jgi:ribosomal protein L11 methyltransferase
MKFKKLTAVFQADSLELAEELICHVFFSFNLKGVVCDIPIPEPDEGFGTRTLAPPDENAIIGYIPDIDSAGLTLAKIREKLDSLSDEGIRVATRIETVDEEDWAHAWKEYFNVTRVTDRIVVKPEWKPYSPEPGELVIRIDPGMAFGTGTHPTTAMCLALLEAHMTPGASQLDVGCGSGILMVAGAMLGAAKITGIDTDPMAVDITRANLEKNQIPSSLVTLSVGTLDQTAAEPYDMITANIIAQVIVDIMDNIRDRLAPGGTAILSGIITDREPDVLDTIGKNELTVVEQTRQEEWVALAVRHRG